MMLSLYLASTAALSALVEATPLQKLYSRQTSWQSYVRATGSKISPVAIVAGSVEGDVNNPTGLLTGGTTYISRTTQQGHTCLTVDFGRNTAGLLSIDFAGSQVFSASGNQRPGISLAFSETLQFLDRESDFTRSDHQDGSVAVIHDRVDHVAVAADPYTWTNSLGCQYSGGNVCSDGLHGFRYVKVCEESYDGDSSYTTKWGRVGINGMHLNYEGFLGTPDTFTGWFECSDSDLTQWWYDGVYTNDLTIDTFLANNTEPRNAASSSLIGKLVVHDGAKRDRDPYIGDLSVSGLTTYLSHDLAKAAENVLADLADHQRSDGWIPPASINSYTLRLFDYSLHWVKSLYDFVFYTGNVDFLNRYYPNLVKVLDTYYASNTNSATGLLNRPGDYYDFAFINRHGSVTYDNALYVMSLRRAADLADAVKQGGDASRWRQRADAVAASLVKANWDSSVGAFFDGGSCNGAICNTHPQDGNSITILANAVNTTLAESALSYIASHMAQPYGNAFYDNGLLDGSFNTRVYAFLSYFEIAARFETSKNTVDGAFEEIRRLYGWMASHDPGITHWEGIGAGGDPYEGPFTSMAHGWSTGIVPLLTNYVLGAKPTSPGFATWAVKPVGAGHGGLTWAKGATPTPHGQLYVEWTWSSARGTTLTVQAPEGTEGVVSVPVTKSSAAVLVDGNQLRRVRRAENDSGYVEIVHTGGTHVYTTSPDA